CAAHPARERLFGQMLLAMHRVGRTTEAIGAYQRWRRWLADELGIDPGPSVQNTYVSILRHDDATGTPALPALPPLEWSTAVPRLLPRPISDFTGREDPVKRLLDEVLVDSPPGGVAAIDGMAGSGKTALALHVANLAADRYPDGQLLIDLHGHSEQAPL